MRVVAEHGTGGSGDRGQRGLRIVDLFCGAGGMSLGFQRAGFEIAAGSDLDPDACSTYRLNFPGAVTTCGDLRDPEVRSAVLRAGDGADVVIGGPPCQAFSQVRNHVWRVDDPRNVLYREFVRVVGDLRPRAFVMENVPGLAQLGVRDSVARDLTLNGTYAVRSRVVDAADFGVPQTRKRILFVGVRASLGVEPPLPEPTGATGFLRLVRSVRGGRAAYSVQARGLVGQLFLQRLYDPADRSAVTVEQAIGDLGGLRAATAEDRVPSSDLRPPSSAYQSLLREGAWGMVENTSVPRINEDTVVRLMHLPPGGNHRDLPEQLLERYLSDARWGPSNGTGRLGRQHFYAYRRLFDRFWSWTLNTKADSVYHYSQPRALSVREFARLQSFPDSFTFTTDARSGALPGRIDGGASHSRYRQAGNAVPPLLAEAVASALAGALGVRLRRARSA